MALNVDMEILQDFLVEASEILEELSEQLIALESSPQDYELLNAIFRGFHTVKGGAGFLALDPLVDVCHKTENLFDELRQGKIILTPDHMDTILEALDAVNSMFEQISNMEEPSAAKPELIETLKEMLANLSAGKSGPDPEEPKQVEQEKPDANSANDNEITEDEFENLLDELHGNGAPNLTEAESKKDDKKSSDTEGDEISEDEFENLLDEIHGEGAPGIETDTEDKGKEAPEVKESPQTVEESKAPVSPPAPAPKSTNKQKPAPEVTVRVDTRKLDDMMNLVGEMVLVRNRLVRLASKRKDESLLEAVSSLDLVTADLQSSVMQTRMQPIKRVFGRFPRVVRDLSRKLNKKVTLNLVGEDTDLDKNLVDALADPLIHLVRNSVDHGVETPDIRKGSGKPEEGTIVLSAEQSGDHIVIYIEDDGAGMDAEALRQKAIDKGLIDLTAAQRLTDTDCFNLIFMPGFSTKDQISDVSGRGVGMDVVKTTINKLNGSLSVVSKLGVGSVIEIKIPLTLAIVPTLMVAFGEQTFALPLSSINEIIKLQTATTNILDGQEVLVLRDHVIPLYYISKWLLPFSMSEAKLQGHVIIVSIGERRVGFVVDILLGQEEVVIKPLGSLLKDIPGVSGATITGDGDIALILDAPTLIGAYA